eukprot:TRINITY_DN976_c0_g1_i2.p1 TRINITY_DN976_c0_g1~~TRINITY_DN976_c0_g1_i2.p1  ORF type:complete len:335 (-),score=77.87 TRINITY_DN976_c0_g1_i2:435-1397(-)
MTNITVHLAVSNVQTQSFVMAEDELCFSAISRSAEQILESCAPKQALKHVIYLDDDGDRCILSDASMSDALAFCKQGALKLQVVGDKLTGEPVFPATERGPALAESELTCSDDEWEIVQAGCQDALSARETCEVNQCSDLEPESVQVCCKSVPMTSDVRTPVDQQTEGATANLHSISELISMGYSKDHAELALAAEDGDVNKAAIRLVCTSELFSSYDREFAMFVLAEQGGDVKSALEVLRRMGELAQVYQEDNVTQTIPNVTSKLEVAIAELGLQFEKAGDTVISSAINTVGRAKQSVNEVSQRAFAGLQTVRQWLGGA